MPNRCSAAGTWRRRVGCLKVNHAATDGAGAKELLCLIASLYRALESQRSRAALNIVPNLGNRSLRQLLRQFDWRSYWRAFRSKPHQPVEGRWRFPSTDRSDRGGLLLAMRRLEPARFDSLKAWAQRFGATLNDVFVAACFRSLWEFLDFPAGTPQSILVPMNARAYLPSGRTEAICNLFSLALFPTLERIPGEPFERTVQRAREGMPQGAKRRQDALTLALTVSIAHRLALPGLKRMFEGAHRKKVLDGCTTVIFTNNGALDPEQLDFGLPLEDAWQTHPAAFAADLMLGVVSFRKALTFTLSYPSRAINGEDVERFLDVFAGQFSMIERSYFTACHARNSPSGVRPPSQK